MATNTAGGATAATPVIILSPEPGPPEFEIPDPASLSVCKGPALQAPSSCYDCRDAITIIICSPVSNKRKTYAVPRELLKWHSSYFAAALDPDSGLKAKGDLCLTERHFVFDAFLCWLYTGRVKDPPLETNEASADDHYLTVEDLMWIWVFADIRGIPGLGNAAIDMYHERIAAGWEMCSFSEMNFPYEHTSKRSNLRKFTVDLTVLITEYTEFMTDMSAEDSHPHPDFLLEAIPVLVERGLNAKRMRRVEWAKMDRCQWHDHSGPGGKLRLESRKPLAARSTTRQEAQGSKSSTG